MSRKHEKSGERLPIPDVFANVLGAAAFAAWRFQRSVGEASRGALDRVRQTGGETAKLVRDSYTAHKGNLGIQSVDQALVPAVLAAEVVLTDPAEAVSSEPVAPRL